jgi:hypothetical protein
LTTQIKHDKHSKISREPRPQTHTRACPGPGSTSKNKIALQDARVHYVVLKQQPQPPHPAQHPPHKEDAARSARTGKPETPGDPGNTIVAGPVASGPNSAPNTTRNNHAPQLSRTPAPTKEDKHRTHHRTQPPGPCQPVPDKPKPA